MNSKELVILEFERIRILILFKGVEDSISRIKDFIDGVESRTPIMR